MGLVLLIDRPGYRLTSDRKVLKRAEAAVVEQITRAYVHAQGEIKAALANLEQLCARAAEDGYRKAFAKGELEAVRRWTSVEVERQQLLQSMQPELAELVVDAVGALATEIDREAFMTRALELVHSTLRAVSWARLRVHPDAVSSAEAALSEFSRRTGLGPLARVLADESLSENGCVLESEFGTIDASLTTQIEVLRGEIIGASRRIARESAV